MWGHYKDAPLQAKKHKKPLKDCKEGSTKVNLNFNKITRPAVRTQLEKGKNGSKKTS